MASSWWTKPEGDPFATRQASREAERQQRLDEQNQFIATTGWTCASCQRINGDRSWCLRCGELRSCP
jgi:hypothetical protein